jgi:hypothetical protein
MTVLSPACSAAAAAAADDDDEDHQLPGPQKTTFIAWSFL